MDLAMVILTALSVCVSVTALCLSYKASTEGNELVKAANELTQTANIVQLGQVEMQLRELIANAKYRYTDAAIQLVEHMDDDFYIQLENTALEEVMNAYDEACAKYLDGKVDKERFKKMYHDEIRQWVEAEKTKTFYQEPQTRYRSTIGVYKEWYDLER